MKFYRYLKTDFLRMMQSHALVLAVVGIVLYTLTIGVETGECITVVGRLTQSMLCWGFILVLAIVYQVYGNCFLDDVENHFLYDSLLRTKHLLPYVLSKSITVFFSSVITVIGGIVLFAFCMRLQLEWADGTTAVYARSSGFHTLYAQEHYILWIILIGFQFGLLAGSMSIMGSLTSLFIQNRILSSAVSVMTALICDQLNGIFLFRFPFDGEMHMISLFLSFNVRYDLCNGWMTRCLLLSGMFFLAGTVAIYLRLKWRLRYE